MPIELVFFRTSPYIVFPRDLFGWLGWLLLLAVFVFLARKWRGYQKNLKGKKYAGLFLLLALLVPLTNLFLVIYLPAGQGLTPPGQPVDPGRPALAVFSAIPWIMAAGFLGPYPGAAFGAVSGLILGAWNTHTPFTFLEFALLGLCA